MLQELDGSRCVNVAVDNQQYGKYWVILIREKDALLFVVLRIFYFNNIWKMVGCTVSMPLEVRFTRHTVENFFRQGPPRNRIQYVQYSVPETLGRGRGQQFKDICASSCCVLTIGCIIAQT